jgi:hypothetical protein
MKERTRQSFEMAHHHNMWRSKGEIDGEEIVQCLASAIRQHAYVCNTLSLESFDECDSDIELIVTAMHAYKEGNLGLSSRSLESISMGDLFHFAAKKLAETSRQN